MGIPSFLLGLTLILVFGVKLGWLPISGTGGIKHLILPVIALSMEGVAVSLRLMRSSMLEEFHMDYVRALRAKGLRARTDASSVEVAVGNGIEWTIKRR